jgi:hypothetical protein
MGFMSMKKLFFRGIAVWFAEYIVVLTPDYSSQTRWILGVL